MNVLYRAKLLKGPKQYYVREERTVKKNKTGFFLAVLFGLIAILACRPGAKVENSGESSSANDAKGPRGDVSKTYTDAGKTWITYDLEKSDIKIELPGKPADKTPPLPPGYTEVFSAMNIQAYDDNDLSIGATELSPAGKRKWNIKELADTSMMATKRQLPDLKYTLDITSDSKAKYNGTFTKGGKSFELRGCCIYKKEDPRRVWAVLALYAKDNADAQRAAQRAIDSVVFENSSEECE